MHPIGRIRPIRPIKKRKMKTPILFLILITVFSPLPITAQPSWTDFTYTDWSPDSTAAITGGQAYDSATVWDGDRFVTFFQSTGTKYLTASSANGRDWSYLNSGTPISVSNIFSYEMGNHTVACDPAGFPSADIKWTTQSEDIHFKMWYSNTSAGDSFQYAESTGGINWQAFTEGEYCPPSYKTDTNRYMTKPTVLYRPDGEANLTTLNPMDNRYLMYLNSAEDLDPYYFELHISSNGLDWTLFAWDSYCDSRFSSETIFDDVTFSNYTGEPDYVDTFEAVFTGGVRDGWMLWTHNGDTGPIDSWYSTNGYDWIFREESINEIGEMNSQTGYWNEDANINLDSVRLGDSFFFLRSGKTDTPAEKYQLGSGIRKGPISIEIETPSSPQKGDVNINYRLYSWNNQTLSVARHVYNLPWTFNAAEKGGPYIGEDKGKKTNLSTSIGGYPHTFIWDSAYDINLGPNSVWFRVIAGPGTGNPPEPGGDEDDTTGTFVVSQIPTPSPSTTPTPENYKTPSPTPTIPPMPSPTLTPQPTSTPSITPTAKPTSSPPPTITPTPEPTLTESPTPTTSPTISPTVSPTVTPQPTASPPSNAPPWIYDYDGDGTSDIGIFRGSSGLWAIRGVTRVYFGTSTDEAVPGDYDGDGTTDIGIFRPSSGLWALRGVSRIYFGGSSDDLVQGDYDGSGTWSAGIFRSTSGLWAIRGITRFYFGGSLDKPVSGYYTGGLSRKIGIFRPASSLWAIRGITRIYFGGSSDETVPGDYNGNGTWSVGIFRPSIGLWAIRSITRSYFGGSSDTPIPGDYSGSGEDKIGIFRPNAGLWAIKGATRIYYGSIGDIPIAR